MNRIRKRNAELALLEDSELDPELKSIKDGIEEVKKQKLVVELMDGTSKSVENHSLFLILFFLFFTSIQFPFRLPAILFILVS